MNHEGILVKCGGFSSQLSTHVDEPIDGHPLWSARYDVINPDAVVQTHLDYLNNGADIILTNTYQASVEGFMKHLNLTREESIEVIKKSVRLAKQAKKMFLADNPTSKENGLPLIMASIGPYGAHLCDKSEYRGSYAESVTSEVLQNWHRVRIEACLSEGVDGLAIETIPCQKEAEAVVDLVCDEFPSTKFWVSFQCKDNEHLAHGQKFRDAYLSIQQRLAEKSATQNCMAIGLNCVDPKIVAPLFRSVQDNHIPFVVYSNRGEEYDEKNGWVGIEKCVPLINFVPEWCQLGAKIIGGCCRVYPSDILNIRKYVDNSSKSITAS